MKRNMLFGPVPSLAILVLISSATFAEPPGTGTDARVCRLRGEQAEALDAVAKRCAEDFVRRNGYTRFEPTSDPSLLATENIEFCSSWTECLKDRRGTLKPTAHSSSCSEDGCSVAFQYSDPSLTCQYRIVTMTRELTEMLMQHQSSMPAPGTPEAERCKQVTPTDE